MSLFLSSRQNGPVYFISWLQAEARPLWAWLFVGFCVFWIAGWYLFTCKLLSKLPPSRLIDILFEFGPLGTLLLLGFNAFLITLLITTVQLFIYEGLKACVALPLWAVGIFVFYHLGKPLFSDESPTSPPANPDTQNLGTSSATPSPRARSSSLDSVSFYGPRDLSLSIAQTIIASAISRGLSWVVPDSTLISSFAYDETCRILFIRMQSGPLFLYRNVPANIFDLFLSASDTDLYYRAFIKDVYPSQDIHCSSLPGEPLSS